jgi:hypothetical protein
MEALVRCGRTRQAASRLAWHGRVRCSGVWHCQIGRTGLVCAAPARWGTASSGRFGRNGRARSDKSCEVGQDWFDADGCCAAGHGVVRYGVLRLGRYGVAFSGRVGQTKRGEIWQDRFGSARSRVSRLSQIRQVRHDDDNVGSCLVRLGWAGVVACAWVRFGEAG